MSYRRSFFALLFGLVIAAGCGGSTEGTGGTGGSAGSGGTGGGVGGSGGDGGVGGTGGVGGSGGIGGSGGVGGTGGVASTEIKALSVGHFHTCAVLPDDDLKCWGSDYTMTGVLGQEWAVSLGDSADEMGANLLPIDLGSGRYPVEVAGSDSVVCARLDDDGVKCWGNANLGTVGQESGEHIGDDSGEMGDALLPIDFGTVGAPVQMAAGGGHACTLFDDDVIKCWGGNFSGRLGLGDLEDRGDGPNEMGDDLPVIDLGAGLTPESLDASEHTCVIFTDGRIKCWGDNNNGELGIGDEDDRGDEAGEMGDALPFVELGTGRTARAVACGFDHTCAILDDNSLKCWGANFAGNLGSGDMADIFGNQPAEMGDTLPTVDLGTGRTAVAIASATRHTCAILDDDSLKCWGRNSDGQLGLGDTEDRGDDADEMGDNLPAIDLGTGRHAVAVGLGNAHTCALLDDGTVKCWGNGGAQLGYEDGDQRGDGPGEMGDNLPVVDLGI